MAESQNQVDTQIDRSTITKNDDLTDTLSWMVTEKQDAEYNMRHKHRGLALVFNHENFDLKRLGKRVGTNVDCDNFTRVLKQLDFEVVIFKDCSYRELIHHVKWAARQDHKNNDCILIAIMSHGESGYIWAKDVPYKFDSMWNHFTDQHCPTLADKPKLFFIQACQGHQCDPGVSMKHCTEETDGESSMSYTIPIQPDFLIAYSTIPGFYSYRSPERGSWFMQSLCTELSVNGKRLDILTLLTFVCQRVAVDFESYIPDEPEKHQQKQIPCITTMLTRILRFNDKNAPSPAARVVPGYIAKMGTVR